MKSIFCFLDYFAKNCRDRSKDKRQKRSLRVEELEKRELLCAEPVLSALPEVEAPTVCVQAAPVQETVAVTQEAVENDNVVRELTESEIQYLYDEGAIEYDPLNTTSATSWTCAKRWFYMDNNIDTDADTDALISEIEKLQRQGYNGMVWKCYVEDCGSALLPDQMGDAAARIARMKRVKAAANAVGVEVIPTVWAVGYGSLLNYNANLVEGVPVKDVPMKVSGSKATFDASQVSALTFANCNFNAWNGSKPASWELVGGSAIKQGGTGYSGNSLLVEPLNSEVVGLYRNVDLVPGEYYRLSGWIKVSSNTDGDSSGRLHIYDVDGEKDFSGIGYRKSDYQSLVSEYQGDSTRYKNGYVKIVQDELICLQDAVDGKIDGKATVTLAFTVYGKSGDKFWLDEVTFDRVEQQGLIGPIRRSGTPITVKKSDGTLCSEGKDWRLPSDYELIYRNGRLHVQANGVEYYNPEDVALQLTIPSGSSIKNGETVYVSYYYPAYSATNAEVSRQYGVCLSEVESTELLDNLYSIMAETAITVNAALEPQTWFLAYDEARIMGTCSVCADSGLTLAQIAGKSITKQYEIIKGLNKNAEVVVWSDMFDPNHNANYRNELCNGDLTDTWKYIPNDVIVCCWNYGDSWRVNYYSENDVRVHDDSWQHLTSKQVSQECIDFFNRHNFRTIASVYYDEDIDLAYDWIDICNNTTNCIGVMYTSWYTDSGDFDWVFNYSDEVAAALPAKAPNTLTTLSLNSNSPQVGTTLTASTNYSAATATYQWYRKKMNSAIGYEIWTAIDGATSKSYTPTSADVGCYLKVAAVGTGAYSGSVTVETAKRVATKPAANFTINLSTDTPVYNVNVRTTTVPTAAGYSATYQWYRSTAAGGWSLIDGATAKSYLPKAIDVGHYLKVVATGTGAYESLTASDVTAQKVTRPIISVTLPTTVKFNTTIQAFTSPSVATATYTWYRGDGTNWTKITTKTSPKYVPVQADVGKYLKVVVTGTGYYTGSYQKVTSSRVTRPMTAVLLSGNGSYKQGTTITAYPNPGAATVTYQWYRGKSASSVTTKITGATGKTYKPTAADVGYYLKVVVKGTGYYTGQVSKTTTSRVVSNTKAAALASVADADAFFCELGEELDAFWATLESTVAE